VGSSPSTNIQLNQLFITKLQEINSIYGQQQLENIKNTINLIREFKILNIQHNLLNNNYNSFLKYLNFFNKNIQNNNINDTINDNINDNINDTINDTINDNINDNISDNINDTAKIFSDDYCIRENNNQEIDLSSIYISTNIDNETVIKYFNKLNVLKNINIQKSINWCKKHQFAINKEFISK